MSEHEHEHVVSHARERCLRARVEEQHDREGDLVWTLTILATTYDRGQLDRIAEQLGCELSFAPVGRGAS